MSILLLLPLLKFPYIMKVWIPFIQHSFSGCWCVLWSVFSAISSSIGDPNECSQVVWFRRYLRSRPWCVRQWFAEFGTQERHSLYCDDRFRPIRRQDIQNHSIWPSHPVGTKRDLVPILVPIAVAIRCQVFLSRCCQWPKPHWCRLWQFSSHSCARSKADIGPIWLKY